MVKNGPQQYCLRWKYHHNNLQVMFIQLLQRESFCDVTLACEGKMLRAHKVVLSACSTYFDKIFSEHEEKDPVVILKDVKFVDIKALVEFMYRGEINVENSHLTSLLKTAEELKIKGLADASGKGITDEQDDTLSYAPAHNPRDTSSSRDHHRDHRDHHHHRDRDRDRDHRDRERSRSDNRHHSRGDNRQLIDDSNEYDDLCAPSLLEGSVSIHDGSDDDDVPNKMDASDYMESSNEQNFSTLISHLQDYRTDKYDSRNSAERDSESSRGGGNRDRLSTNTPNNATTNASTNVSSATTTSTTTNNNNLSQFSDVIKMNDYLTTGRRQQFWEEPFTRRLMEAIKNKEIEMKAAAELMGVSYGTLYGRYRDAYGCLKHPYRTKDFWAEQGPADILARLQKKEITLFRAAEMLNVTVTTLANYLATLRYEKQHSGGGGGGSGNGGGHGGGNGDGNDDDGDDDEEEMDVNEAMEVYMGEPVTTT